MQRCFKLFHDVLCFEKAAETAADDARLRHESWILSLAAHPGVVSLVEDPIRSGGRTVVRTRAVTGRPLAAMDALSASEVAGIGAAVATTVADLHDVGITHGRLRADHVIVDTTGRPVLCGFSEAMAATCSPTPAVSADLKALGLALGTVVTVNGEPHAGRPAPLSADAGADATTLARLLDGLGAGGHRDSARRLAARLDSGRFAARLPSRNRSPVPA